MTWEALFGERQGICEIDRKCGEANPKKLLNILICCTWSHITRRVERYEKQPPSTVTFPKLVSIIHSSPKLSEKCLPLYSQIYRVPSETGVTSSYRRRLAISILTSKIQKLNPIYSNYLFVTCNVFCWQTSADLQVNRNYQRRCVIDLLHVF